MIYVSSSCVKANKISESIEILANAGFKHIELSGGTKPYSGLEDDLLNLRSKYDLRLLCHNYFPPPSEDFVLNLASLEEKVAKMSLEHCKKAIDLSRKIGAKKYAFHAGFLINIPLNEIGKQIKKRELFDHSKALKTFHRNLEELIGYANGEVELYIENNVLSKGNYLEFKEDPFFFTNSSNLAEAKGETKVNYLLDLAHLKVSCSSLGLDYHTELKQLIENTDYIHLSGNDGISDLNWALNKESEIFQSLLELNLSNKTITLETYEDLDKIKHSYDLIEGLL